MSVFSTVGWILRVGETLALLASSISTRARARD